MFERYLAEAIATHFSHIISDFDSDKVKFSVWNGEVVLKDLTLKEDAIQQLKGGADLPFKISHGHIGTFELHIPWNVLKLSQRATKRSKKREKAGAAGSCSVILSDVNILISPGAASQKKSAEKESKDPHAERILKERMIQNILDEALFRKNIQEVADSNINDSNHKKSFVKNLVRNILSSLTITVRNVHIRYEDPGDCIGFEVHSNTKRKTRHRPPFAVGIALEEFSLGNAYRGPEGDDKLYRIPNMEGITVQRKESTMSAGNELYSVQHKLAAAKNLSVYWDSDLASSDLIHMSMKRIIRRSRIEKLKLNNVGRGQDSFEDEDEDDFGIATSRVGDRMESETMIDDSSNELFSSMLDDALHSQDYQRTFIVQPISPSLHCTIVSAIQNYAGSSESHKQLPPSRAVLTLPSFQMSINKNTLEDIAHLRRSYKLWNEMRTSFLARKVYTELTSSRPEVSPLENPRSWWLYSFEAVKALSHMQKESEKEKCNSKKGWVGFVEAVQRRREYVNLYRAVLNAQTPIEKREELNAQLCDLEDSLKSQEIVAFRVDAVSKMLIEARSNESLLKLSTNGPATKGTWFSAKWKNDNGNDIDSESPPLQEGLQQELCREDNMLTIRYREAVYTELVAALDLEEDLGYEVLFSKKEGKSGSTGLLVNSGSNSEITVLCPQMLLQIDDITSARSTAFSSPSFPKPKFSRQKCPVVQVRCASIQKICFHQNSNWDMTSTFASLEMLDLMETYSNVDSCPKLLTRKRSWVEQVSSLGSHEDLEGSVLIGTKLFEHGGTIYVNKFRNHGDSSVVTSVNVKLSPMEMVYSPETVQTLSKVFSSTKTSELTHDYQRLKLILSNWKAQQKERIIEVLSQKENRFVTNVDIAAPVFLMHDKTSNGTLVVDLGRLLFRNAIDDSMEDKGFDDTWKLSLQNVQVLSMPRPEGVSPSTHILVHYHDKCHLVEPFSLEFMIDTKFMGQDSGRLSSQILIDATLPRLVFNLSSSAVRLVHRLTDYRAIRKLATKPRLTSTAVKGLKRVRSLSSSSFSSAKSPEEPKKTSTINFRFSAPFVALRLGNDVDGRDCVPDNNLISTKIVELTIQGIGGELCRTTADDKVGRITFTARLKSLHAEDLYQQAGKMFSNLLSSKCLEDATQKNAMSQSSGSKLKDSDLVRLKFSNNEGGVDTEFGKCAKTLSIQFHELYVEWNPETIAAIQKALRLTVKEKAFFKELGNLDRHTSPPHSPERHTLHGFDIGRTFSADESFAFFDAMEEESDDEDIFLSDFSSDGESNFDSPVNLQKSVPTLLLSPLVEKAMKAMSLRTLTFNEDLIGLMDSDSADSDCSDEEHRELPTISVTFELSRLRFRFNKESRLRRLIVAEMNETLIRYQSKPHGGAKTIATFGNFTLTDPSTFDGSTLYGEILGLKTDANRSESMLKITHETFPRDEDNLYNVEQSASKDNDKTLRIDKDKRCIKWCDTMITMHFSPMRFVLLQQLWMEVMDYFFEGIIGFEVQGRQRPDVLSAVDEHQKKVETQILNSNKHDLEDNNLPGANADGMRFLRFDITMDSPVIILPVQYRSPQHLRFDLDAIHIRNKFSGTIETLKECAQYVQWYNNCSIDFQGLRLLSWCGTQLNISEDPKIVHCSDERKSSSRIPMKLIVRWPVGPSAHTIVPKWNFHCSIDNIR
jgi:hypothetical protein